MRKCSPQKCWKLNLCGGCSAFSSHKSPHLVDFSAIITQLHFTSLKFMKNFLEKKLNNSTKTVWPKGRPTTKGNFWHKSSDFNAWHIEFSQNSWNKKLLKSTLKNQKMPKLTAELHREFLSGDFNARTRFFVEVVYAPVFGNRKNAIHLKCTKD